MIDFQNISVEASAAHFAAASKADPNFGLARVMAGFTGGGNGWSREQSLAEINRGVVDAAAHGGTSELLLAAAYREGFQNNQKTAGEIFLAASHMMPGDPLVAANALAATVNFAFPVPAVREFIDRHPHYAPMYNTLAYTLWPTDHAGALAAAKRQVELLPNAPNPHDTYAELLQWNGNFPEAIAEYRLATTTAPNFPGSYSGMAEVAALQGGYAPARAYLNDAIAKAWNPQQRLFFMQEIVGTYGLQGTDLNALRKQSDAVVAEAKAQQNMELAAIQTAANGAVYASSGNTAGAHKAIADAKVLVSPEPWQVDYYATTAHTIMKHWAPAAQELATLKQRTADNPDATRTWVAAAEGNLDTQQGRPADALKILMAADTTNFLVMNRIADAHAALGHKAEANAWYSKITNNYALALSDLPGVRSRMRARSALSSK